MLWKNIQQLKPRAFKRLVGVQPRTFQTMVLEVKRKIKSKRKHPDKHRPNKYSIEDQVLMTLMYWREYRTMFHIASDYGLSESTVCRTIQKVEDILNKSKKFELPGKKAITKTKFSYDVLVVDSTESPIERPKKNSTFTIRGRRSGTP